MAQLGTKKSRRGCVRCKQRRVKCNEEAPCSNCVRRNEDCSLLEPTPTGSDSTMIDPALPGNSDEWIQDLELMHHYTESVNCKPRLIRSFVQEMWRDRVPKEALKHRFLMHGILAFSALHLAYLHPDQAANYLQLCDKHQAIALNKFRNILSADHIDPDAAEPLHALSATISLSSLARTCAVAESANDSKAVTMDDAAELLYLVRGVRDVIALTYEHLKSGPTAQIFTLSHPHQDSATRSLPPPVAEQFTAIRAMLDVSGLDAQELTPCASALQDLEEIYRNIMCWAAEGDVETGQVFRWPTMIATEFVRQIQARSPPALIIFAHYIAATTALRTAWYQQNWAEYALRGVSLELDPSMHHWLDWPRRQLDERMAVLGVVIAEPQDSGPTKPIIGFE